MSSKRKRNSYDSAFKLKVIEYAENHNNCAAEREFGVTEKMVREWRKKKSELGGARKSAKRLRLTYNILTCNMKRPSIPLILSWIRDAWHDIPSQMIVKSFKKCCISNAMDGSEDDALYSDLVKPREANGADDENEQTPDVVSDDAQPDTFDELDNVYDDLYDDNVMTETEFHELFGDSDDEEWTYLTPDGRPC